VSKQNSKELLDLVYGLSNDNKEVMLLTINGFRDKEIAQITGFTLDKVKSMKKRIRKNFRKNHR